MTDYPKFASITAEGDGDGTGGGGRGNFCAHIIFKKLRIKCYLSHGGFCARLLGINRLRRREFS